MRIFYFYYIRVYFTLKIMSFQFFVFKRKDGGRHQDKVSLFFNENIFVYTYTHTLIMCIDIDINVEGIYFSTFILSTYLNVK